MWIFLLMHKQILKDFCQYQGKLTSIFFIPFIILYILIPPNLIHYIDYWI
jgi:hypothetical protein